MYGIITTISERFRSLLRLLASSLKWLVRPLGKGSKVREHGNVVRLMVGSLAVEQACNARGSSYLCTRRRVCRSPGFVLSCLCPGCQVTGGPILLYFLLLVSVPLIIGPYRLVPRPMFVPKRRSQQGIVESRTITTLILLLETSPFIGPNTLSLDNYISLTNTSLPVRDFSSRRTCIFNIDYLHIFHTYHRVSRPVVLHPVVPLYKYHI